MITLFLSGLTSTFKRRAALGVAVIEKAVGSEKSSYLCVSGLRTESWVYMPTMLPPPCSIRPSTELWKEGNFYGTPWQNIKRCTLPENDRWLNWLGAWMRYNRAFHVHNSTKNRFFFCHGAVGVPRRRRTIGYLSNTNSVQKLHYGMSQWLFVFARIQENIWNKKRRLSRIIIHG